MSSEFELKSDAIQRYTTIMRVVTQGFDDVLTEIRDGFTRTNHRLDNLEQRLDRIEAELRRINPNGKT